MRFKLSLLLSGFVILMAQTSVAGEANCLSMNAFGYERNYCLLEGDVNGDGEDEIIQYYGGLWSFGHLSSDLVAFGGATDLPVLGDWNGDGFDSLGIFKQGVWYLSNSNEFLNGSSKTVVIDQEVSFGSRNDTPITGDWTGVGMDSIGTVDDDGVFRLAQHRRYGRDIIEVQPLPGSNDPIVGDFDRDGDDEVGSAFGLGQFWWVNNVEIGRGGDGGITVTDPNDCLGHFDSGNTTYTHSDQLGGLIGITTSPIDLSFLIFNANQGGDCDPLLGVIIEIIP